MDSSAILVFFLVFLIGFIFSRKKKHLPPGPFTIPYVGSVGFLKKLPSSRPQEVFTEEARRHGPIFKFNIANQTFIVINSFELIQEALVKNADTCSGRPNWFNKVTPFNKGEDGVLFNQYGESWRQLRRFTLQALRDFGVGKTSIEEKIVVEVDAVTSVLRNLSGQPISISLTMQKVVANVVFGIVFGRRYEYDDPEFERILKMTHEFMTGDGLFRLAMFLPDRVRKFMNKIDTELVRRERTNNSMQSFVYNQINDHETTFDNDNIRDFVDIYWRTAKHKDDIDRTYITKGNMFRVIMDLFLAGSETTSGALDWTFLFMAEFPEVQKKCQDELDRVIGDRIVEYSDRNELPYINATLTEIHRLAVIAPLGGPHAVLADNVKIRGYDIPKDSIILPNLYATFQDPQFYRDPKRFNPDRFINKSGQLYKTETVIPFSAGPRICLGEPLARMELMVVFTNLLQRFTFSRGEPSKKHSLKPELGHLTSVPEPYKIIVHTRS